jgi:hypothetical protein
VLRIRPQPARESAPPFERRKSFIAVSKPGTKYVIPYFRIIWSA